MRGSRVVKFFFQGCGSYDTDLPDEVQQEADGLQFASLCCTKPYLQFLLVDMFSLRVTVRKHTGHAAGQQPPPAVCLNSHEARAEAQTRYPTRPKDINLENLERGSMKHLVLSVKHRHVDRSCGPCRPAERSSHERGPHERGPHPACSRDAGACQPRGSWRAGLRRAVWRHSGSTPI